MSLMTKDIKVRTTLGMKIKFQKGWKAKTNLKMSLKLLWNGFKFLLLKKWWIHQKLEFNILSILIERSYKNSSKMALKWHETAQNLMNLSKNWPFSCTARLHIHSVSSNGKTSWMGSRDSKKKPIKFSLFYTISKLDLN